MGADNRTAFPFSKLEKGSGDEVYTKNNSNPPTLLYAINFQNFIILQKNTLDEN
jgi:hypothetical protein